MLANSKLIGFVSSTDLSASKSFYANKLGLHLKQEDEFALEFLSGATRLRISKVEDIVTTGYTVLGWEVADIESTVTALMKKGVEFEHYPALPQNEQGICAFPGGSKVAWFKDPHGNTLSITQLESSAPTTSFSISEDSVLE